MKEKNVLLGIFALVLAVGSAFASILTPLDSGTHAKVSGVCRNIQDVNCGTVGTLDCQVTISGNGPYLAYPNSSCTLNGQVKTVVTTPFATQFE